MKTAGVLSKRPYVVEERMRVAGRDKTGRAMEGKWEKGG